MGGVGCRARCWAAVCSKTLADWMGLDAVIKSELVRSKLVAESKRDGYSEEE